MKNAMNHFISPAVVPKHVAGIAGRRKVRWLIVSRRHYESLMRGVDYGADNIRREVLSGVMPGRAFARSYGCSSGMEGA